MTKRIRSVGKVEPDIVNCRTSRVGALIPGTSREMYYCGIDNAFCSYARPFGFDYLCNHVNSQAYEVQEDADQEQAWARLPLIANNITHMQDDRK